MLEKRKVFAYITHGERLLVFRHPHAPEAGTQVPAGSIKEGESPEVAVMREAQEETGLTELRLICFLGEHKRDMREFGRGEVHHRFFYHLRCEEEPPAAWRHCENDPAEGEAVAIEFHFFWARLPHEVPALIADHDRFLKELLRSLGFETAQG